MMMTMSTMQWWWRQTNMREHARFYLWPKLPLRWGPPGQPSPILRDDGHFDDWWYFPGRFFSTSNFHWLRSRWTSVGFSANARSINITTGGWGNRHQYTQIIYYHQNHLQSATSTPIWIFCQWIHYELYNREFEPAVSPQEKTGSGGWDFCFAWKQGNFQIDWFQCTLFLLLLCRTPILHMFREDWKSGIWCVCTKHKTWATEELERQIVYLADREGYCPPAAWDNDDNDDQFGQRL